MTKQEQLDALDQRVMRCRICQHLADSRTQTVFGVGNPDAEFMFVGEAPGRDEDKQGEPFVGRAGRFLDKVIRQMGFEREDIYLANILKCRPDAAHGNRKPELKEMRECLPFLKEQILIVRPKVIIALGATAMEGLFHGDPCRITRVRGRMRRVTLLELLDQKVEQRFFMVMPTFHPAYVLRNPSEEVRHKVWIDMCRAMELAGYDTGDRTEWTPEL